MVQLRHAVNLTHISPKFTPPTHWYVPDPGRTVFDKNASLSESIQVKQMKNEELAVKE